MRHLAYFLVSAICASGSALGQSSVQELVDAGAVRLGMKEISDLATGTTMVLDLGINKLQLKLSPDFKTAGVYTSLYGPFGVWGTWSVLPSGHLCYDTVSSSEPNPARRCLGIYLHKGGHFAALKGSPQNPVPPPTAPIFGVRFQR